MISRRTLLMGGTSLVAAVAGCTGLTDSGDGGDDESGDTGGGLNDTGERDDSDSVSRPITSFAYDYDESEETLEIIVQSGERFTAGQVQFRGSGFADTGTSWAAVDGEDVTPESTVGAGEGVTLTGVGPAFELDVVWESGDESDSVIISTQTGPDA